MVTDARSNNKTWLDTYVRTAQLTNDAGTIPVKWATVFAEPPYPLEKEFHDPTLSVDLLYVIHSTRSTPLLNYDSTIVGYDEEVPIEVACITKTGITGPKLWWKAVAELRYVAETYPEGSRRTLDVGVPNDQQLGSTTIYSGIATMKYRRGKT